MQLSYTYRIGSEKCLIGHLGVPYKRCICSKTEHSNVISLFKLLTRLIIMLVVSLLTLPSLQNAINVCARKHITSIQCLPNDSQANSIYYVKYEKDQVKFSDSDHVRHWVLVSVLCSNFKPLQYPFLINVSHKFVPHLVHVRVRGKRF